MYLLNDNIIKKQLYNLIKKTIFVNLDEDEQDLIFVYVLKLLHIINLKYNIPYKYYKIQIFLNNSRDIYTLISLLLPYIDTKNNYENFKSLKKLSDIFLDVKYPGYNNNKINSKNLYKYSTIELDLGSTENNIFKNNFEDKIKNNISFYLESNLRLLLETIEILSFKSYINWINIFPISFVNYKQSNLFKNTFKYNFKKNNFESNVKYSDKIIEHVRWWHIKEVNPLNIDDNDTNNNIMNHINYNSVDIMNQYSGLPINQVYDNFVKLYYTSIEKFKFLIEDIYNVKKNIPLILYIDIKLNNKLLIYLKKNINWEAINDFDKLTLKELWNNFLSHNNYIVNLILLYFEFFYEKLIDLKNYNRVFSKDIKLNFNEYDLDEKINLNQNNTKKIINNFNEDNFKYIYDFLLNSFNEFKLTPYYFIIFDKNETNENLFDIINKSNNNNNLYKIEKNTNNLYFIGNLKKNIKIKYEFFKFTEDNDYEKDGEKLFEVNNIDYYLLIRGNDGKKRYFLNINQINNNNEFVYIDSDIYNEIFYNNFNKLSKKDNNLEFEIVQKNFEKYLKKNNIDPFISIKDLNELFFKLENENEIDCNEFLIKLKKKNLISSFIFPEDIFEKKVSDYKLLIKLKNNKKLDKKLDISCSNLYNFGKLLYNINYSPVWNNLNNLSKIYICDIFNFNFSNICNLENNDNNIFELVKKYFSKKNKKYDELINLFLFNYIRIYSFDITFKTLLRLGILSEFKFNPELTDFENEIKGKDMKEETINQKKKLKIQIENYNYNNDIVEKKNNLTKNFKDLYKDNYYYLNNQKYNNIKVARYKNLDYFDILLNNDIQWFTKHCFNWLIQLDFYNKFINKSVLLITGGTGQGKSVHVPKLIHYGLKAIDLNLFGKTVITQPRITPVVNNTEYISNELMVPIKDYNEHFGKNFVFTENGEVQFIHSKENFINNSIFYYLRLCTDGNLLSNISQNILLKKKIFLEKKVNTYYYLKENIFDIIGIDESHEHNVNMDLILTLLKYSIMYNKSIRLFIISATLDEDEHIYRRFYKNINETTKYPLNMNIYDDLNLSTIYKLFEYIEKNINIIIPVDFSMTISSGSYKIKFTNNNFYLINTINNNKLDLSNEKVINIINKFSNKSQLLPIRKLMDRRFHISPPGKVTQFEITEYYEKIDPIKNYDDITAKDVENANLIAINRTLDILNKTTNGEILLFSYSRSQCIKICKKINEKCSLNDVALPFFSEMNYKYKEYLQNLDKFKDKINFDKNVIVDIYANELNDKNIIGNNKYKRIIIIATNIAEASITIPNLKFVIDLGIQLTVKYDNENEFYENKITSITESSRTQRKGRVGRTDTGTVYYIYTKHAKEPIIPQYKICIENLTSSLYNHLLYKNYLEIDLFYSINYYNKKNYFYLKNNFEKLMKKYYFLPEFNIFQTNFTFFNNKKQKLILKNLEIDSDDDIKIYVSGFDTNTVIDNELNFYIIHPIQNKLNIDIRTGLISDDVKVYKINTNYNYLNILKKQNLIVDLNYKISLNIFKNVEFKIAKTKINVLFTYLTNYMPSLNYNSDYYIIMIYSILLNCENDIIIILSALDNLQNYNQLFKLDKFINIDYEKIYKNKYSNIFNIITLVNEFINEFDIFTKKQNYNLYDVKYKLFQKLYNNELKTKFDKNYWELFLKFKRELQLNNELNKKIFYLNNIENLINNTFDEKKLDKWCSNKLVNKNIFKKILLKYINLTKEYNNLITEEKSKIYNFFDILNQTIYINKSNDKNSNIIKSLLFGFKQNVVEYNGSNFNHLLSNNIYYNKNLFRNMYDFNLNPTKFLFFLKKDPFSKNEIIFLINLFDPKIIFESGFNIYNLKTMVKKNNNLLNHYDINLINKELIFIRFKESKFIDDIKLEYNNKNLQDIINDYDRNNNIDNIEINTINKNIYFNRYIILNLLNFYYYFIRGLIKN